jgi:putative Holliday junction resolvase
MRILGLDYGAKTVGVAVSDPLGITAQALETVTRERETKLRRTVARIAELCEQYEIEKIVLGLPLLMSDEIGDRAQKAIAFGEMLKKRTGLEVIMWDERLTTVAADEILDEMNVRGRHNRKAVIDQIAAGFILQEYLDAQTAE